MNVTNILVLIEKFLNRFKIVYPGYLFWILLYAVLEVNTQSKIV